MPVDNIGISRAPEYKAAIQSEKTAVATRNALQDGSTATLGDRLAVLQQQLNAMPASAHRDTMLQIYQNLLDAGQSFEKLSGKSLNEMPLQEKKPVLDKARATVEKDVKMFTDTARVTEGKSPPAAREASAENLNNAHKQLKTSQDTYSRQQQSATGQLGKQFQAVMTGGRSENLNSAHKQPETTLSQRQPQQRSADVLEQQMKAAMTGSLAGNLNSTHNSDSETERRLRSRQKRAAADNPGQPAVSAATGRSALPSAPMPRLGPIGPWFPDVPIPVEPDAESPWEPGGDFAMFWGMQEQIGQINTKYIKTYQYIMGGYKPTVPAAPDAPDPSTTPDGGYTAFFKDLSAAMNDKVNYLSASSTSGQIIFRYNDFKTHFDTEMAKYTTTPPADNIPNPADPTKTLYRYPLTYIKFYDTTPEMTTDQKTALFNYWKNNLSDGFYVEEQAGGIQVWIDTTIIKDMSQGITDSFNGGPTDMLSQIYSAWETKWNGNQNTVSSIVQRITDLYSSSNRVFDNLVRIMTSAFQSCVDCAKEFLRV